MFVQEITSWNCNFSKEEIEKMDAVKEILYELFRVMEDKDCNNAVYGSYDGEQYLNRYDVEEVVNTISNLQALKRIE